VPGRAQRFGLYLGMATRSRVVRARAGGVCAWRGRAGGWREAEAPEAVASPTRHRGEAGGASGGGGLPRCHGVVRRAVGGEASGAGASRCTLVPSPPNKGLQATVHSLRSCLAAAIGGA
jgi:hypothetical protein